MIRQPVYVIDGARTPFLKSKNRPGPFAASDLAVQAGRALLVRQKFAPQALDEVILGCAAPSVDEVNIGRVAALRMGCGNKVPGWTVMRNCASGMQALDSGINSILAGRSEWRPLARPSWLSLPRRWQAAWTSGGSSAWQHLPQLGLFFRFEMYSGGPTRPVRPVLCPRSRALSC